MTIHECMNWFIDYVSSYSSPATVVFYRDNLSFFTEFLGIRDISLDSDIQILTKADYVAYIAYHRQRGVKNTSAATYARSMRAFLRWCYNEGYLLDNITKNVKFPKNDCRLIVPLTQADVDMLRRCIGKQANMSCRDHVIFSLMLDCGLRLGEVVELNVGDIHFDEKYISIRNSKNNKSRVVPLPDKVAARIKNYMRSWSYTSTTALITDYTYSRRITERAIENIFARWKRYKNIYPHLLRHTFATSFIMGGGSLEVLRILLGHSDYNVTRQYLHIAEQMKILDSDIYRLDDIFFRVYNYRK